MKESLILDMFYFFGASALCVPFFKTLGLGSVLGYIVGGIILGEHAFGLLKNGTHIQEISEIGIILLLFVIGLELSTERLSRLKENILKDGLTQFSITTVLVGCILKMCGLDTIPSFLLAIAIALSSTAFALVHLKETNQLTKSYGQSSISILLFQDLIIIPALTIIPFLASTTITNDTITMSMVMQKVLLSGGMILFAKYALLPTLTWVHKSQSIEIFIATTMLFIFAAALCMQLIGLSKAVGAFLTGIFLSNTNFKTDIHKVTVPLKSMLMGVFFMGLGLALDLSYIKENFLQIVMVTTLFMSVKFGILLLMGNYKFKNWTSSLKLGVLLSQGGEFGLLIITSALGHKLITSQLAEMATACITLSLCVTPLLAKACDHFSMESLEVQPQQSNDEGEEIIANDNSKVIPLVKPESTSEVKEKTAA